MGTTAQAQFLAKGEAPTYNASPAGVTLTGQDGWTNPLGGSADFKAYQYTGNALGLPISPFVNVNGGFFGAIHGGGTAFARAQHIIDLSAGMQWVLAYDIAAKPGSNLPAPTVAASTTLQPDTAASAALLHEWSDPTDPTTLKTVLRGFSSAGQPVVVEPGGAFSRSNAGQWYRIYVTFDFAKNIVLSVGLLDFTTNTIDMRYPGLYLTGGLAGGNVLPTGLRLFVGGTGAAGNAAAWDNIELRRTRVDVVRVSGQITVSDLPNPANRVATLVFKPRDGSPRFHANAILAADGSFRAYVARKVDATVWVKVDTALAKIVNVNTTNGDIAGVNTTLINGDITNDNKVDIEDLLILIAHYNQVFPASGYLETADLNADGNNDITDLLLLIRNYNQIGATYP